jgi:DNA polymerase-3 subunit epsilon
MRRISRHDDGMMQPAQRYVVLDTETTGLNARTGDRVIEIGCVEMIDRRTTGRHYHTYLNPEREIDAGATAVHGFTLDDLRDKPKFAQVARDLVEFCAGAVIIIHNAPFDVGFLDAELGRVNLGSFTDHVQDVIDSLGFARELHPGKRNSLDALCDRYGISNAHRALHGALLDAELLAEVYLAMTRGQDSLVMDAEPVVRRTSSGGASDLSALPLRVLRASDEELLAHEAVLDSVDKDSGGKTIWRKISAPDDLQAA